VGEKIFAIENLIKYIFLYDPRYDKVLFVLVKKLLPLSFLTVITWSNCIGAITTERAQSPLPMAG
jgi:hypothetical protein